MENTPDNIAWAITQLNKLRWMNGYPKEDEMLYERARRLLKVVSNKTVREIREAAYQMSSAYYHQHLPFYFEEKFLKEFGSEDRNDVDWLLDKIGETMERFPSQVALRRMYGEFLRPYDGVYAEEEE